MADREPPYDPYIPNNGNAAGNNTNNANGGNQRTAALQAVRFPRSFRANARRPIVPGPQQRVAWSEISV